MDALVAWLPCVCVVLIGSAVNAFIEATAPRFVVRMATMFYGGVAMIFFLRASGLSGYYFR